MEINPQLVPGSVWSLKSGALATVLAVSNEALSTELLERFPRQVVYLNASHQVNTQPVESFTKKRTFAGIDDEIVAMMSALTDPEPEEEGADFDIDSVDVSAEDQDPMEDLVGGSSVDAEDELIPVFFPPTVGNLSLDSAFISYSEQPSDSWEHRLHVIRFGLSSELTVQQLTTIFTSGETTSFVIDSEVERVELENPGCLGVFVEVDAAANGIAAVYLSTDASSKLTGEALDAAIIKAENELDASVQAKGTPINVGQQTPPTHVIPQISPQAGAQPTVVVS